MEDNFVGTVIGATWQVVDGGDLTTGTATGNTAGFITRRVANGYDSFAIQASRLALN